MSTTPRPRSALLTKLATSVRAAPPLLRAPVVLPNPLHVHTPRLLLRPLAETDREEFTALLRESRTHLARHLPLHRDAESDTVVFERQLAYSRGALATGLAWRRVVCLREGPIIGAVNLNDITPEPDRTAEMNFWIGPRHAGLGLCAEAMRAMLHHALSRTPNGLGLAAVWGYIAPDNDRCLRLLDRLGFTRNERALPVQLNLDNRWVTHHAYTKRAPATTIALQRLVAGRTMTAY